MAGIDASIYSNFRPADLFGSVQRGLELRNTLDQRERQKQDLAQKAEIQKAYQSGIVQNPDGSTSYDIGKAQSALGMLTGNPYAGEAAYNIGNTMYTREQAAQKQAAEEKQRQIENQRLVEADKRAAEKAAWDREQQLVNMGKTRAETSELMRKPTLPTEIKQNQATAAGFGRRLEQAEGVFDDLSSSGYDRGGFVESISSALPSFAQGSKSQQQEQAERNYINAVLRRESGAAISPTEFESAEKQYFPRFGDSPEVVAQKKANREQARIAMQAEAGKAWDQIPLAQRPTDFISPVRVIAPDGTIRTIPKNQLKSALASGGKLAE